ncbi:MAG: FecR domain-containing protein, partial [Verrucomicrobia bacterium]|nr:FecR domain-containing protein [Verrucomicrobiota bacterium]
MTDTAGWQPAKVGQALRIGDKLRTGKQSRATVRLADLSVLRISELTLFEILPPLQKEKKPLLDLKNGLLYFFSREKPTEVQFRTPTVGGAIRGTEFVLQAMENGETLLALLDGEVELGNEAGQITLRSGEQARAVAGQAPTKTALIDAISVIQWCLYYPAVVNSDEINFTAQESQGLRESLAAYRAGDLLKALATLPADVGPPSEARLVFEAALQLSVGRVDQAEKLLQSAPPGGRLPDALREMIAAVQGRTWTRLAPPTSVSEKLAHSYYLQSLAQLEEALKVARAATAQAPSFGFAWARVAELEFSFGRARQAGEALGKALQLSPRNAQALALNGFIFAAQERVKEATVWFDKAIEADGALGNAWLGRGLCRIRLGQNEEGRKDLQVAAALEPQRALLRSYLGKAFSQTGQDVLAEKELRLAKKLDSKDPTGWLYSALLNQQRSRVNEAIHDLERSQELNENQKVFRSKLLLDQDAAVRGANLATIYQDAGLTDVSLREAAKAVNSDYANYSAHLFLANSYAALRDPKFYNLRYDS